jgi:MotA/TolQ/ExbB proton channel family protein
MAETAHPHTHGSPAALWRGATVYQITRSLLAWTALTLAIVWAARDVLHLAKVKFSFETLADWLTALGYDWLGKVVARMGGSDFEQVQLLLFVLGVAYGTAQIAAALVDRHAVLGTWQAQGRTAGGVGLAALLLARPPMFFLASPSREELALHFLQGREIVFGPLRLALWLFPVLGFLGTVIGVSAAIEKLPNAMKERGTQLSGVINELHFAFDTTFIGLVAAIGVMLITWTAASMWERNEGLYRGLAKSGD